MVADDEEGDILFLPANWPHTVLTTVGPSISLTHNFLDEFGLRLVRTAFLLFKTRNIWRTVQHETATETSEQSADVTEKRQPETQLDDVKHISMDSSAAEISKVSNQNTNRLVLWPHITITVALALAG